ncbi:alpha/beta hydrolase family protein [Nocardioides cynanchi]|uniref:alpha/beta hydrolase family protein n=1 Tax=Nocardioides cynanchi TaxID=2558918 RepID=UPI001EE2EA43|nr:alpha/beta hydrolase [Nocardioides cynanchi]
MTIRKRPAGAKRIGYGDDPAQFVELTMPAGEPKGVVVVVHGGFWKAAFGIEYGRPISASLADHGWAAWNIEYRRVGNGGGDPTTFDDVAAAIDALSGQDLDLSRVLGVGHSAGGHLATWAASRTRFPRWKSGVELTGVVSQAGVLDLSAAFDENLGSGAVVAFLGHRPGRDDAPLDPIQQVPLAIPVHCIHGTSDTNVPISQSRDYVAAAVAAGAAAELTEVDGDHFVLIDPKSDAWHRTLTILDGL